LYGPGRSQPEPSRRPVYRFLFVEKSSACQQMSEVTGLPEQKIEEMLLKIKEENTVDHIVNSTQLSDENAALATESVSPCPEQLEIPYPEEIKNSLKEQVVTAGKNWDSSTLHSLVVGIASERNIVLTEESWNIVDEEKDPDLLVFTLALISNYQGTKGQLRVIEHILKHLKEAKHAWEKKEKYKVKSVYLYGSLARGKHFDHRSDIDLMVEDFPAEASYWRMLVELEEITAPVEVNVVLSEDACPGLRNKARKEGKLL